MPSEGRLYDVARAHRAQLLAHERQTASEMVHVYGNIWQRIQAELDALLEEMHLAQLEGYKVDEAWLWQQERYQAFLRQTEDELKRFAQYAESQVLQEQQDAIQAALSHTEQQVRTVTNRAGISASWVRLPTGALEDLVGFTANGSPLFDLLAKLGPDAAQQIRDVLLQGIALGWNPERTAGTVREAFGGDLARALRVSRTETLRVYRESTRRAYRANDEIVEAWIWNCACTLRSCAMCWAMHGTVHPLTERLNDHPLGRCSMLPYVRGAPNQWQPESGVDQFAKLEPNVQRNILGPAAFEAYQAGAIKLEDVVGQSFSKDWGWQRRVKSLREMIGVERARKFMQIATRPLDDVPALLQVPVFEAAQTAEHWAKVKLQANVVYHGETKIANVTNRALAKLAEQKYALPQIVVDADECAVARVRYEQMTGRRADPTPAMYWQGKVFIDPDDRYWKAPESFARNYGRRGFWSSGAAEHPLWHEVAHAEHERRYPNTWWRLGNFMPQQAEIARKVSLYAGEGPKEFVAEVIAAIIAGKTPLDDPEIKALFVQWGW